MPASFTVQMRMEGQARGRVRYESSRKIDFHGQQMGFGNVSSSYGDTAESGLVVIDSSVGIPLAEQP